MKVIDASVQEIKQAPGIRGIYQHIEKCGRTCYKSEDKITDDSAMKFFQGLVSRKHYAMLEHGTVYFKFPFNPIWEDKEVIHNIRNSKYSFTNIGGDMDVYCTTNMRVLIERVHDKYEYLIRKYALEEQDVNHIKRITAKFVISRAVANEFVRHRVFSFAQESTRYCNYTNDKFGSELTFIRPEWLNPVKEEVIHNIRNLDVWFNAMADSEDRYFDLINHGVKPQDARGVLPLDLKTELVMTGTIKQWEYFFDIRMREVTGPVHPDAKAIVEKWYNEKEFGRGMDE